MIDPSAVDQAARRLGGISVRTPLLSSPALDRATGGSVICKAEGLQRTGSFKIRGAWNAIAALPPHARANGVITFSSGNHGRALAFAARMHDVPVAVVLPTDVSETKRTAIARAGAEIIPCRAVEREGVAVAEAERRGMTFVAPYDDPNVIAGQGTVAREMFEDAAGLDVLLVPVSGGGLLAGCALAAAGNARKAVRVIGVEPATCARLQRSLTAGRRVAVEPSDTIADAQRARIPGALTFPILLAHRVEAVCVTDEQLVQAMQFAFEEFGIVCEPSGASALAAVLAGVVGGDGARIGVVLTGANIALDDFAALTKGGHLGATGTRRDGGGRGRPAGR
ncbi:threonine/serine dehydratase [Dactylosporangium sp. AC04546]|uniref:threonine ammonia-lyase n=1 Tax=Dactylosporangium sp. AC04546 TaxID=2862460 RepID=UPI001EDF63A9|nr:threonine/serine dehydratase [Dactylosporangium sp. AC04546]WVK86618.1 threonine/serine dehydratase [Dactylosporangium sp. AC04546]